MENPMQETWPLAQAIRHMRGTSTSGSYRDENPEQKKQAEDVMLVSYKAAPFSHCWLRPALNHAHAHVITCTHVPKPVWSCLTRLRLLHMAPI